MSSLLRPLSQWPFLFYSLKPPRRIDARFFLWVRLAVFLNSFRLLLRDILLRNAMVFLLCCLAYWGLDRQFSCQSAHITSREDICACTNALRLLICRLSLQMGFWMIRFHFFGLFVEEVAALSLVQQPH